MLGTLQEERGLMEAGKLDRLIRIEQNVETRVAGAREVAREWVLKAQVWADVGPSGGGEGIRADQPVALQGLIFTIRYREDVSPAESLRIVYEGQPFNIVSIDEIGRREGLAVKAEARAEVAA